jgi:hypothetical protein
MGERPHQQGVAISFGGSHRLRTDNSARARLVLDDDAGAEVLCHLLRQHAGNGVGAAARRKGNDDLDDAVRIGGKGGYAGKQRRRCQHEQRGQAFRFMLSLHGPIPSGAWIHSRSSVPQLEFAAAAM